MKTFLVLISLTFSVSGLAQIDNSKKFAVCEIYYCEGDSNFSKNHTLTRVRFKNDHLRIKNFEVEKTKHTGGFEFDPQNSTITLTANGNSKSIGSKELFSTGKTWLKSEFNSKEWLSVSCESKTLEEAFYELMRAYDEKVGW